MKKADKQHFRTRIRIPAPQGSLSIDMEERDGIYYPAAETSSRGKQPETPQKPDDKIKLKWPTISAKKVKHLEHDLCLSDACQKLCDFPKAVEGTKAAATLLLLVLLCQAAHLLVEHLPAIPLLCLDAAPRAVRPVLQTLLTAIQGPEQWKGCDWKLRRPWIVQTKLRLGESKPSSRLFDYIGGTYLDTSWEKRKFCFPFLDSAMVLMPELPNALYKQLVELSPLAMPIVFGEKKGSNIHPVLNLSRSNLDAYDNQMLEQLNELAEDCRYGIISFLEWFHNKKKHIEAWKSGIDVFRPVVQKGRFQCSVSDPLTDSLCAALSFFQQYLYFASQKRGWLTPEMAEESLHWYWRLVLPESAPATDKQSENISSLAYDAPSCFYQFLTEHYLPTYHSQILQEPKGTPETMGLLHCIGDGPCHLIAPRSSFLKAYRLWLEERHITAFSLSEQKAEAAVQRRLCDMGVPLKHENNNPATWRYLFHKIDKTKSNPKTIPCFALPIPELPEEVQTVFGRYFGSMIPGWVPPNCSDELPN